MVNTTSSLKNVNLLSRAQYDAISNPAEDELWAVESPCIVETYQNGTSWYRVYSDGWCEQGGKIITAGSNTTVQLLKEMDNTEYNCLISLDSPTNQQPTHGIWYTYDQQRTYFKYYLSGGSSTYPMFWEVKGYIA